MLIHRWWVDEAQGCCPWTPRCLDCLHWAPHSGAPRRRDLGGGCRLGSCVFACLPITLKTWSGRSVPPPLPAAGALRRALCQPRPPPQPPSWGSFEQGWPRAESAARTPLRVPYAHPPPIHRETGQRVFLKKICLLGSNNKKDGSLFCNNRMHFIGPLKPISLTVKSGPQDLSEPLGKECLYPSDSPLCPSSSVSGPQREKSGQESENRASASQHERRWSTRPSPAWADPCFSQRPTVLRSRFPGVALETALGTAGLGLGDSDGTPPLVCFHWKERLYFHLGLEQRPLARTVSVCRPGSLGSGSRPGVRRGPCSGEDHLKAELV